MNRRSRSWLRLPILVSVALAGGPAFAADVPHGLRSDAEVLGVLSVINENEINAGDAAVQKNPASKVLDFAKMMEKDHSDNQEKTLKLAQKAGTVPVETVTAIRLRGNGEAKLADLKALSGPAFDAAYMAAMVDGHEEALKMIDGQLLTAAQGEAVKQHLRNTRERVAKHLEQARDIRGELMN